MEIRGFCMVKNDTERNLTACDNRWVHEFSRGNDFFSCDTACLEYYPSEKSDCKPGCNLSNDICGIWWKLRQEIDTDKDGKVSLSECVLIYENVVMIKRKQNFNHVADQFGFSVG